MKPKALQWAPRLGRIALMFGVAGAMGAAWAQSREYIVRMAEPPAPSPIDRAKAVLDDRYATQPRAWGYLKPATVGLLQGLEKRHGFQAKQVYSHALNGFSAELTPEQLATLRQDPSVLDIEAVLPTRTQQLDLLSTLVNLLSLGLVAPAPSPAPTPAPAPTPSPAPAPAPVAVPITLGPAPSSQSNGPTDSVPQFIPYGIALTLATQSWAKAGDGTGTVDGPTVYVIDSGIGSNSELNVVGRMNFIGGTDTDCYGHGSHVSGTIGARDNAVDVVGMAPGVKLYALKTLGCDGTGNTAVAIKAVDWVTANAIRPAVANISFTSAVSKTFDDAVRRSVASGVVYTLAAGNEGTSACLSSPGRIGGSTPGVLTAGASDEQDNLASYSNYGSCVDLWAPGSNVVSTRPTGGTYTLSGTSMAAPHLAGAAALYMARNPQADPGTVTQYLKNTAVTLSKTAPDGSTARRVRADIP